MPQRLEIPPTAKYQLGLIAHRLRELVDARKSELPHLSDADVARNLGFPEKRLSSFSRWLNGHVHPESEEDWGRLTKLGISREELRRLERLDKLDAWRRERRIPDVEGLARLVHELRRVQIAKRGAAAASA